MTTLRFNLGLLACLLGLLAGGCAAPPKDYTAFQAHRPRSILVLPPLNESTNVAAPYSCLSVATRPLAEMGYYIFPVSLTDELFKANGMPTPGEMHQVPLNKVHDIIGADAVLYLTVKQYGTKYVILSSNTEVLVTGRLVDVATGTTLWEGSGIAMDNSGSSSGGGIGGLIASAIVAAGTQIFNSSTDHAHEIAPLAFWNLAALHEQGLLYGPYSPQAGNPP